MKKSFRRTLGAALAATMIAGCMTVPAFAEDEVTLTLGIWPEDTLEGDIAMHEGFVEKLAEKDPNVTVVPAYYKYSTDTFMPMVEAGTVPTIFETWFTEPRS